MMEFKSMATPMVSGLKEIHVTTFGIDLGDSTMYTQLIGSLLYLVHRRPNISYAFSVLS